MIKFREQVPLVYTNTSRDFQYLSWLIDIVLNSVKHNIDSIYNLPNLKADTKLTELLAMTLGFKVKRNYDQKQLAALVEVLPRILRYKGTELAVVMAGEALIAASGATGAIDTEIDGTELRVSLPKTLVDVSLFSDLLPYILPAGMTYRILRTDFVRSSYTTESGYSDTVLAKLVPDLAWDYSKHQLTGLTVNYESRYTKVGDKDIPINPARSNFIQKSKNDYDVNNGLLDNNIIPVLDSVVMGLSGPMAYGLKSNSIETTVVFEHSSTETNENDTTVIIGKD
jgi:hypothetical protein